MLIDTLGSLPEWFITMRDNLKDEKKNKHGWSLLHYAVIFNAPKFLSFLLDGMHFDANPSDAYGTTPIGYCGGFSALADYSDCVKILVKHGASLDGLFKCYIPCRKKFQFFCRGNQAHHSPHVIGMALLERAIRWCDSDFVKFLLERKVHVNSPEKFAFLKKLSLICKHDLVKWNEIQEILSLYDA